MNIDPQTSLSQRTLYNVFSRVISSLTYLIFNIFSTRILGPSAYGDAQYIVWFVYTVWTVTNFAIPTTITRYLALGAQTRLINVLQKPKFFLISAAVIFSTVIITWYVFRESTLLVLLLLIGVAGSLIIQAIFEGAFLNRQHFYATCYSSAITLITFYPIVTYFELIGYIASTTILLASYLVIGIFQVLKYFKKYKPTAVSLSVTEKEIFRFALFTWLAAIVSLFVWQRMEILFIKMYLTSVEVGYFTVGFIITNVFIQLTVVIVSSLLPYFAQNKESEFEKSKNVFIQNVKIIAWGTIFSSFFIAMNTEWIVHAIFGSKFSGAVGIVSIMAATIPIPVLATVGSVLIRGRGRSEFIFYSNFGGAVVSVVLYIVSLHFWQLGGLVYARFGLLLLLFIAETTFIHFRLKYTYPSKDVILLLLAAAAVVYGIHFFIIIDSVTAFLISGFLALFLYSLSTLVLRVFSYRDVLQLVGFKN